MVLRSELDEDVKNIIDSLETKDYHIPTIWMVSSPVLRVLQPFYVLIVVSGIFSWFYHGPHELWSVCVILIFSLVGALLISLISVGILYFPNILLCCIDEDVKRKSFLCVKFNKMTKRCVFIVHLIGVIISIPFILTVNWGFLAPFGVYFMMILISCNVMGAVMSRYLTSEIISVVGNFRKNLSQQSLKP